MTEEKIRPDLETAALLAFDEALASGHDNSSALRTAIQRYPSYAALLADYALSRVALRSDSDAAVDALVARVASRADALLAHRLGTTDAPAMGVSIVSLLTALKERGSDAAPFARSAAVGMSVLAKLDRRLIDMATIPRKLVIDIARALDTEAADIWRYLEKPPTLARGASYRSAQNPELKSGGKLESFTNAIATAVRSGEVAPDDANAWRQAGPVGPPDGE